MNSYSIALFLHIVGMLGFALVLGLEWIGLSQVRRAKLPEEARAILGMVKSVDRLGFISMLITLVTGIYMVLTAWGWVPWVLVVLGSLVLGSLLAVRLANPRIAAMEQALASAKGSIPPTIHDMLHNPILWISIQTRVAIVLGIILLKFTKPNLGESLLTIGVAIFLGVASALLMSRRVRVQEAPAD